jgi:PAS domain S-box-containing protein
MPRKREVSIETAEYKALVHIAHLISTLDLKHVLTETLKHMTDVTEATKGSIVLLNRDHQPYQRYILQRNLPPEVSYVVMSQVLEGGLAGWCVREKRGTIAANVEEDERWLVLPDDEQEDVKSAMCVPFIFEDRVQGVMTLVSDEVDHFDAIDLQLATAIASQASTVIHNAYLFDNVQTHKRQLETILQNTGDPLFMLDESFQFMLVNRQAASLLQRTIDGLMERRIDAVSDNPMWGELATKITETKTWDNPLIFELRDYINSHDYTVNVTAIQGEENLFGYVVVFTDITAVKDLSRLKTHMLRMASHDLKNPLNIAVGYVDLLEATVHDGEIPSVDWIREVALALDRMNTLIDELLDAERIERESQFRSTTFDPNELIQDAIDNVEEQLLRKKQKLVRDIETDLIPLTGDHTQLRQAMINYLSNAIKYTPDNGTLTLRANISDSQFNFIVEDTGLGIPERLQDRIFKRGYRAYRDTIAQIDGSGIGLSLVAEICRRHHGNVWFESQEHVGSKFGFWIPVNS